MDHLSGNVLTTILFQWHRDTSEHHCLKTLYHQESPLYLQCM